MAQVKGHAYLSYVSALRERNLLWQQTLAHLTESERQFFSGEIFASVWYPRSYLHSLLNAIDLATGGDAQAFRDLGVMSARFQFGLIYRTFMTFSTPAFVFRRAAPF